MTAVLCYHHVTPAGGVHANTPERLHDHLSALRRRGFSFIDFDTFAAERARGRGASRRTVLVTTDDGYVDNLYWAMPVLRDLEVPAVFFVITDRLGEGAARDRPPTDADAIRALSADDEPQRFLRWEELRALDAEGLVAIESHTHRHEGSPEVEDRASLARLRDDLAQSIEALRGRLGRTPRALAWPWGRSSVASRAIAHSLGLRLQFSVTPGRIGAWSSPRLLSRVCVDERSAGEVEAQVTRLTSPMVGDAYSMGRIGWNVTRQLSRRLRARVAA